MAEHTAKIRVRRFDPGVDEAPYTREYVLSFLDEKLTLLQALNLIQEKQDETLALRQYCCGHQFCNSCMMRIDGKAQHACRTLVFDKMEIEVAPLANKKVIRDLVVED